MPTHRGFSAWIASDGKVLDEYLVAVDPNTHQVQCWIPSEEGKTFGVHWKDLGSNVDSCAFISLDGFMVPGRFLFGKGTACREGVRSGQNSEKPFMFTEAEETNTGTSSEVLNKDSGTITLKIKLIQRVASRDANEIQSLPEDKASQNTVGQLRIAYGEERQTWLQSPTTWHFTPVSSHVTFIFRYRSREFLLAQGIMPGNHVPAARKSKRPAPCHTRSRSATASSPTAGPPPDQLLVTPSPTPSPKTTKTGLDHLSQSMKKAFYPGMGRMRQPRESARTVSSRASNNGYWQGLVSFNDAESGQDTVFVTEYASMPVQEPVATDHPPNADPGKDGDR